MKNALTILALLLVGLMAVGAGCTKDTELGAIVAAVVSDTFSTAGYTEATDADTAVADVGSAILDAVDEVDLDDIDSVRVTGVCYAVDSYAGTERTRTGSVTVDALTLATFNIVTNSATAGCSGDGKLNLDSAGMSYVNEELNDFLDAVKAAESAKSAGGTPTLEFTYIAAWSSSPSPSSGDPDNFSWHVDLKFQIYYSPTVELPDI